MELTKIHPRDYLLNGAQFVQFLRQLCQQNGIGVLQTFRPWLRLVSSIVVLYICSSVPIGILLEVVESILLLWSTHKQVWSFLATSYEECGYSQLRKTITFSKYKERLLQKSVAKVLNTAIYLLSPILVSCLIMRLNVKEPDHRTSLRYTLIYGCSLCSFIFNTTQIAMLEANIMLETCQYSEIKPPSDYRQMSTRVSPTVGMKIQTIEDSSQAHLKGIISSIKIHHQEENLHLLLQVSWIIAKHYIKNAILKLFLFTSYRSVPQSHSTQL